jgi:hypothetical protein
MPLEPTDPNPIEFRCHYCDCWFEPAQTEPHFASAHDQKGVTFETLQTRLASLGGMDIRNRVLVLSQDEDEQPKPAKRGNWLFSSDDDPAIFQTNNFQHER